MIIKLANQTVYKYIPVLSTFKQLNVLLQQGCTRKHHCVYTASTQVISICLIISRKVSFFRNNELFSNILLSVQIILYHDDFQLQLSNPLGNKIKKYKIFAFYFVLQNISGTPLGNYRVKNQDPWKFHMYFS